MPFHISWQNDRKCSFSKLPKRRLLAGHLKKDCPDLTEDRRKELQDLYTMKVERKGQGTGRKKNKKSLSDNLLDKSNSKVKMFSLKRRQNEQWRLISNCFCHF